MVNPLASKTADDCGRLSWCIGVKVLFQVDTELFPQRLEVFEVFLVLVLIFDFGFDACSEWIQSACREKLYATLDPAS